MGQHVKRALALAGTEPAELDNSLAALQDTHGADRVAAADDKLAPMTDDQVNALLQQIFGNAIDSGVADTIGDDTKGKEGSGTTDDGSLNANSNDDATDDDAQSWDQLFQALGC